MWVYDDLKMKSLIKKKTRRTFNLPTSSQGTTTLEGRLSAIEVKWHCCFSFGLWSWLIKKKSSPIVYYIQHTYLLGTGLIFFLQACYPFLEVKTSVSHIQSKIMHLNRFPLCSLKHYLTKADASQLPMWTTIKVVLIPS